MEEREDNLPRIQERIASIHFKTRHQNIEDTKTSPVPTPSGDTHSHSDAAGAKRPVKSPVRRQLSHKYLRHISFNGDSPTRETFARGRTGSMAGDLRPERRHIRQTNVLLLYTGGALGWKLIEGGEP